MFVGQTKVFRNKKDPLDNIGNPNHERGAGKRDES